MIAYGQHSYFLRCDWCGQRVDELASAEQAEAYRQERGWVELGYRPVLHRCRWCEAAASARREAGYW